MRQTLKEVELLTLYQVNVWNEKDGMSDSLAVVETEADAKFLAQGKGRKEGEDAEIESASYVRINDVWHRLGSKANLPEVVPSEVMAQLRSFTPEQRAMLKRLLPD